MKRILAFLTILLMLLPVLAAAETVLPLTAEELSSWSQAFLDEMVASGSASLVYTEDGYMGKVEDVTLYLASGDISRDAFVLGVVLNVVTDESRQSPRGIMPSNSLEALLGAYPNDNPTLAGTREKAVLYVNGSLPGTVAVGIVSRDGQLVQVVEHCLYISGPDGVARQGMVYSLENNTVTAVRMYRSEELIPEQQAQKEIMEFARLQEEDGYFAFDTQSDTVMEREDLTFAGIDFFDATPEDAVELLGKCPSDTRVQDSTGEQLRIMQWTDIQITFLYDASGTFLRADILTINGNSADGPRGLRTGDTLESVLSRFLSGDNAQEGDRVLLYGDGVTPPYGLAEYSSGYATVRYVIGESGIEVALILSFEDGRLASMMAAYL